MRRFKPSGVAAVLAASMFTQEDRLLKVDQDIELVPNGSFDGITDPKRKQALRAQRSCPCPSFDPKSPSFGISGYPGPWGTSRPRGLGVPLAATIVRVTEKLTLPADRSDLEYSGVARTDSLDSLIYVSGWGAPFLRPSGTPSLELLWAITERLTCLITKTWA